MFEMHAGPASPAQILCAKIFPIGSQRGMSYHSRRHTCYLHSEHNRMVMESFMKENRVSLLTIPRSDLNSSSPSEALLLQLPPGWKPSDLKNARFVAAGSAEQQAALVVESKKCSFSCYTVETSNSFIMVPPPLLVDSASSNCRFNNNKRSKVLEDGKTLTTVHARLLKMGGAGASFLELREKKLQRSDLLEALKDCVWNPYDDNNPDDATGRTVDQLAAMLQLSPAQIREGLAQIPNAMRLPRSEKYVLIAEEPLQECYTAVVAALTEVDDFQNYAEGICLNRLIEEALYRMSKEESFADADHVLKHCLGQLSKKTSKPTAVLPVAEKEARVRLDVGKVAVCVARRLLQKESAAGLDVVAFTEAWQSELPGTSYHVELDMLLGVAVVIEGESKKEVAERQRCIKYLPADKLPMDPKACFDELFQIKERWFLRELEPYLDRLIDGTTTSELLLRFTKTEMEERDGISTKVYLKK